MNHIKNWTRRLLMTALFVIALLSSFRSISGVEAKSIFQYLQDYQDQKPAEHVLVDYTFKVMGFAYQFFEHVTNLDLQVPLTSTVVGEAKTLEEAIDWTQYPIAKVVATGYTAYYESTGKNPDHPEFGITYSGVKVKRDLYSTVAADLDVFPIGTILFVPGYGYGVVADKGGAIKGNMVDLYYETVDDVYNEWGKKTVDVYVVQMGDGTLTEDELNALNENESMQVFRQQYMKSERK